MIQQQEGDSVLLSKREEEILGYISKGLTSKDIASVLYLSKNTVDTHRRNMIRKSKVRRCTELVRGEGKERYQ